MKPTLIVDHQGTWLRDPSDGSLVGIPGPFGRERVVEALPLNKAGGAVLLGAHGIIADAHSLALADPAGNLLGRSGVWIHRMLDARWTQDTRSLAG